MADLCLSCGEYVGQNDEDSPYCKCHRDELKELKEDSDKWKQFEIDTKNKDVLFLEHEELMKITNDHAIVEHLKNRIRWTREQLDNKTITPEISSTFQWFLQHLISIETGEFENGFQKTLGEENETN